MPDTTAKILKLISERINPAAMHMLTPDTTLDSLGLCSIERLFTIPVMVEEAFGLDEFPEGEIQGWQMVSDIVRSIEARRAE